jgi:lipopolysaccharide biosynthesis glycosyltransferase
MKTAVVTVSNDKFIKGVLVLFYSFHKHNPWFDGDYVVISDGISEANIRYLRRKLDVKLKVVTARPDIHRNVAALAQTVTHLQDKASRFYSITAFGLSDYDKVLFLDSDMLCVGDVSALFQESASGLVATHDGSYYKGQARHRQTYEKVSRERHDAGQLHDISFNAGMMVISGNALSDETYEGIVGFIDARHWQGVVAKNADQIPLNKYFDGRLEIVDGRYNFRFSIADEIQQQDGVTPDNIRIYHYTGKLKPWNLFVEFKLKRKNEQLRLAATRLWKQYYREVSSAGLK